MAVITISRQFGSNGEMIAEILAQAAECLLLNRKTLEKHLAEHHIPEIRVEWLSEKSPHELEDLDYERAVYLDFLKETVMGMSEKGHVFLLGRGGQFLFKDEEDAFHIKVVASLDTRVAAIQKRFDVDKATALRLINQKDAEREEYTLYFHRSDSSDPHAYDILINTSKVSIPEASEIILFFLVKKGVFPQEAFNYIREKIQRIAEEKLAALEKHPAYSKKSSPVPRDASRNYTFANESEEEFARILDYYKIDYLYEPTTFPLRWDSEGNVESAFTPDFYFPEFDLYIELTTMKQDLVTKKNRKLRELRSVYPDVNVRLFYRKDYKKLLEKFGISQE